MEYTFKTKRNKYTFLLFKIVGFYFVPIFINSFSKLFHHKLNRQNWMPALEGWRPKHALPNPPRCFDTFSRRHALVTLPVNSFECLFMTRPTEGKPGREKRKLVQMVFNSNHILLTAVY